jgi:hypothetical protein
MHAIPGIIFYDVDASKRAGYYYNLFDRKEATAT